jgi:hypothetical protein
MQFFLKLSKHYELRIAAKSAPDESPCIVITAMASATVVFIPSYQQYVDRHFIGFQYFKRGYRKRMTLNL